MRFFREYVEKHGSDWLNKQVVRLGNLSLVVESGTPGVFLARQNNGEVIRIYNTTRTPATPDLRVEVGRSKSAPNLWQIIRVMEDYDVPADSGQIAHHAPQHMFGGSDMLPVDRKQITYLVALAYSGLVVQVYGGLMRAGAGYVLIDHQLFDLSSQAVTGGARYVNIEADANGTLSANPGTVVGSVQVITVADIPAPSGNNALIASVLMFESQDEITNDHILVPLPVERGGTAGEISDAAADTPADGDKFGFWDVADTVLKSITWANLKAALQTYFNAIYSVLGHSHDASTITGKYRQFVWVSDGSGGWEFVSSGGEPVTHLEDLE